MSNKHQSPKMVIKSKGFDLKSTGCLFAALENYQAMLRLNNLSFLRQNNFQTFQFFTTPHFCDKFHLDI